MQRRGFTLIELSIVLIIIGLIIGGVMKGTDMINSAKQKKVYNTWIKSWQVAINQYQDRTGQILGDGTANGGNAANANGNFDNRNLDNTGQRTAIENRLRQIGIEVPTTNIAGNSGRYSIEGKYITSNATMGLNNVPVNTRAKNVIQLNAVPTDVAIALDTMIDGRADSGQGNCVRDSDVGGATPATHQWPDAQTTDTVIMYITLN